MITMEPIMDFDLKEVIAMMEYVQPFQINIGSNTNKTVLLPEPNRQKLIGLILTLSQHTNVKLKNNSSRILGNQ